MNAAGAVGRAGAALAPLVGPPPFGRETQPRRPRSRAHRGASARRLRSLRAGEESHLTPFADERLARLEPLWARMLEHPFLIGTRDGTIPDATFARWMRQDYLFVEAAIPFLGALLARAPRRHRDALADAIGALRKELELFRERAAAVDVDLDDVRPSFICHAYIQYLMATALGASYEEAYAVLYTAERAYHDSWKVVEAGIDPASPWLPFVENWAGEPFGEYVAYLEGELDALAAAAGPAMQERMARHVELATRYEIAFWQMALEDEGWPGIPAEGPSPGAQSAEGTAPARRG